MCHKMMMDAFQIKTTGEEQFFSELNDYSSGNKWAHSTGQDIQILSCTDEAVSRQLVDLSSFDALEAFTDTCEGEGTKLFIKVGGDLIPIGESAKKTLLERCRLNGGVLADLDKSEHDYYADMLNHAIRHCRGEALVFTNHGKLRAIHAGDERDYCVLDESKVFKTANKVFKEDFEAADMMEGYIAHDFIIAKWLIEDKKFRNAYADFARLEDHDDLRVVVIVSTSNTGKCGANISYRVQKNAATIVCGNRIDLPHKNGATLEKFEENARSILGKFRESLKDLKELEKIKIRYPEDCLRNVMEKYLNVSQKLISETTEMMLLDGDATALDIYITMCDCIQIAEDSQKYSAERLLKLEECIARTITADWGEYDYIREKEVVEKPVAAA